MMDCHASLFRPLLRCSLLAVCLVPMHAQTAVSDEWSTYGGNLAGQHASPLHQINPSNVGQLGVAWTFHTGVFQKSGEMNGRAAFEANAVFWNRMLFVDSPLDQVFAIDAATGKGLWSYDPLIDRDHKTAIVTSRGVTLWHDASTSTKGTRPTCADRVYVATLDARLIALDATTGKLCQDFGTNGMVDLTRDVNAHHMDEYQVTSPATVVGDTVIVGSSIGDGRMVEAASGIVRGYDARSGRQMWVWDPIPWARTQHPRTGAGNAWSAIAADPELGLVYVPTGSPSPDFYGVYRPGDNRDANSVVALEAKTGRRVWGFQVVHHDLWDYDVAAEPTLFTFRPAKGKPVPAVAVSTKMGMVFVLNRITGEPLQPVEERPVPQSKVDGEVTSPTQPFSSLPPLAPLTLRADDLSHYSEEDNAYCRAKLASVDNQGIYTPISTRDTLLYPGSLGGVNWGSPAIDDATGVLYANVTSLGYITHLEPQPSLWARLVEYMSPIVKKFYWKTRHRLNVWFHVPVPPPTPQSQFGAPDTGELELSPQSGTPYRGYRASFTSPDGMPCTPMPWGQTVALNLNTGEVAWRTTLGTMTPGRETGSPSLGGPMITAGGLIFSAATVEPLFRAFDRNTGKEVWRAPLPASAQATPMTYQLDGRQYVVIAAGGHGNFSYSHGDSLVAFALPKTGR